jgi:nucleotide-binding universal stress UspA family protein
MTTPSQTLIDSAPPALDSEGTLRTVVIATDGTPESDGVFALARSLSEESPVDAHVISVCEPVVTADFSSIGMMMPPLPASVPSADPGIERTNRLFAIHAQLARTVGSTVGWPLTVRTGDIGRSIGKFAADCGADLILTGRGRHGVVDRLLGEEHLLRLLRSTDIPVLAAEPSLVRRPTRAVIAIDFSERSQRLIRTALTVVDDEAVVYLVHVKPDPPFGIPHPGQWIASYEDGVRLALNGLVSRISAPPMVTIEPVVLNGQPGVALAEFARRANADLIVAGSQGHGFFNRLVIGSVTARLLRTAPCSLLSV